MNRYAVSIVGAETTVKRQQYHENNGVSKIVLVLNLSSESHPWFERLTTSGPKAKYGGIHQPTRVFTRSRTKGLTEGARYVTG
jgi:hypothetical protein